MNPLVVQQLKRVDTLLQELRRELDDKNEQLGSVTKSRDELRKEAWGLSKELRVLKDSVGDYPRVKSENEHLKALCADFDERLRRILACTRALTAHIRL
jgi:uncharacterized coiled-coil DUF342 family protein